MVGLAEGGLVAEAFGVADDEVGWSWSASALLVAEAGGAEAVAPCWFEEAAAAEGAHRPLVAPATKAATV